MAATRSARSGQTSEGQVGIPPPLVLGQIPAGKQLGQARPHRAHAVGEEVHRGLGCPAAGGGCAGSHLTRAR